MSNPRRALSQLGTDNYLILDETKAFLFREDILPAFSPDFLGILNYNRPSCGTSDGRLQISARFRCTVNTKE